MNFCKNNEHLIINLAVVPGRTLAISQQHKFLAVIRHAWPTEQISTILNKQSLTKNKIRMNNQINKSKGPGVYIPPPLFYVLISVELKHLSFYVDDNLKFKFIIRLIEEFNSQCFI